MLTVGLTGGIACGKSTVRRVVARAGWPTLDLDEVAHRLLEFGGPARAAVIEAFGDDVRTAGGGVDRVRLGRIVFGDEEKRARLNAVIHPRIRDEEERWLRRVEAAGGRLAFVDGALLVETGHHLRFDRVVVVHCREEAQLLRIGARDGLSEDGARSRLGAQMALELKQRLGTDSIDTNGSHDNTQHQVKELLRHLGAAREGSESGSGGLRLEAAAAVLEVPSDGDWNVTPLALAGAMAGGAGLDLGRLADALVPSARPWYRRGSLARTPVVTLVPTLAVALVGARRAEPRLALAAAAALATLVEGETAPLQRACLAMEAALAIARLGAVPRDWRHALLLWRRYATSGLADDGGDVARALDAAAGRASRGAADSAATRFLSESFLRLAGRASPPASPAALQICRSLGWPA